MSNTTQWAWDDINAAATACAGNWRQFECFYNSDDEIDGAWAILYTHNRDSGLLTESNAAAIDKAMGPFVAADEADAKVYRASHWACGWVEGYAIRVFSASGEITAAFTTFAGLQAQLEQYPVLNEDDWTERETNATLENIVSELRRVDHTYAGSDEDLAGEVFSWFWENNQCAVECTDDQGAYPDADEIAAALDAMGYLAKAAE